MREILHAELARFTGRGTIVLEDLCDELPIDDTLAGYLIEHATDPEPKIQAASTWVLHRYLKQGFQPQPTTVERLAAALPEVSDPWARQHLCQAAGHLSFSETTAEAFARMARQSLTAEHKFLRAWALDALHQVARQHPRWADEAAQALRAAAHDEAASVRARARKILRHR